MSKRTKQRAAYRRRQQFNVSLAEMPTVPMPTIAMPTEVICPGLEKFAQKYQDHQDQTITKRLSARAATHAQVLENKKRHLHIEEAFKLKIARLQPVDGAIPMFLPEVIRDHEFVRRRQELYAAERLKEKFRCRAPSDQIVNELKKANEWPPLSNVAVGNICAAKFSDVYCRATILSLEEAGGQGAFVEFHDYGTQWYATDLKQMPPSLDFIPTLTRNNL